MIGIKLKLIIMGLVLLAGASLVMLGANYGKTTTLAKQQVALEQERNKSAALADALSKAKANRDVIVQKEIEYVYKEADPTGCNIAPAPERVYEALAKPY